MIMMMDGWLRSRALFTLPCHKGASPHLAVGTPGSPKAHGTPKAPAPANGFGLGVEEREVLGNATDAGLIR